MNKVLVLSRPVPEMPKNPKEVEQLRKWMREFIRGTITIENTSTSPAYDVAKISKQLSNLFQEYISVIVEAGEKHNHPMNAFDAVCAFERQQQRLETQDIASSKGSHFKTDILHHYSDYHEYWNDEHLEQDKKNTLFTRELFLSHVVGIFDALGQKQVDLGQGVDLLRSLFEIVFYYPEKKEQEPTTMDFAWSTLMFFGFDMLMKRFFDNILPNLQHIKELEQGDSTIRFSSLLDEISISQEQINVKLTKSEALAHEYNTFISDNNSLKDHPVAQKKMQKLLANEHEIEELWKKVIYKYYDFCGIIDRILESGDETQKTLVKQLFSAQTGLKGMGSLLDWNYQISDISTVSKELFSNEQLYTYLRSEYLPKLNIYNYHEFLQLVRCNISIPWHKYDSWKKLSFIHNQKRYT